MSGVKKILWYADGYHAGLFLRDYESLVKSLGEIFDGLRKRPYWKVNLEIEAYTLEVLAERGDGVIGELKDFTRLGRVEIISGSYTQPLPWVIDGESNIRQLSVGKQVVREVLDGYDVLTYAVQEPCWSSQLPQLLSNLGFRWCALKNHFGYFGRPPKCGKGKVFWVGPDGSRIESSPSYVLLEDEAGGDSGVLGDEGTRKTASPYTSNDPGVRGDEGYMNRCYEAGIQDPIGFFIEDIGGAEPSHVDDPPEYIRFALWREYFESTRPAKEDWLIGQEDFKLTVHWGMPALSRLARVCHTLQAGVQSAEKLSSLASIISGAPYPESELEHAWRILMKLQHHDPWLVPESRLGDFAEHPFPWWVEEWTKECLAVCRRMTDRAVQAMAASAGGLSPVADDRRPPERSLLGAEIPGTLTSDLSMLDPATGGHVITVFNPLGMPRRDMVEVHLEARERRPAVRVVDSDGQEVPSQQAGQNGETVAFIAEVPAWGWRCYRSIEYTCSSGRDRTGRGMEVRESGPTLALCGPFFEVEIDRAHGGCLSRLFDRRTATELLDLSKGYGNDFAGCVGGSEAFSRASENPARVEVTENGPVRTCVRVEGTFHSFPFVSRICLYGHAPIVDFKTDFRFEPRVWVGDGYKATTWREKRQSWHVDRKKLQVQFPVSIAGARLYKDAAFEVIESRLQDPFHETWDDVKTNAVLNWVDVSDGRTGLALFTDRTTSYGHSSRWPLSLILAWGELEGTLSFEYSILPHAGTWRESSLPAVAATRDSPLVARMAEFRGEELRNEVTCMRIEPSCVLLSAAFREGSAWFLRFYNASDQPATTTVEVPIAMGKSAYHTDLAGRPARRMVVEAVSDATRLGFDMRPFGIETIRFSDG